MIQNKTVWLSRIAYANFKSDFSPQRSKAILKNENFNRFLIQFNVTFQWKNTSHKTFLLLVTVLEDETRILYVFGFERKTFFLPSLFQCWVHKYITENYTTNLCVSTSSNSIVKHFVTLAIEAKNFGNSKVMEMPAIVSRLCSDFLHWNTHPRTYTYTLHFWDFQFSAWLQYSHRYSVVRLSEKYGNHNLLWNSSARINLTLANIQNRILDPFS